MTNLRKFVSFRQSMEIVTQTLLSYMLLAIIVGMSNSDEALHTGVNLVGIIGECTGGSRRLGWRREVGSTVVGLRRG